MPPFDEPCALVIAHPGHEARIHGWLESARPHVFVLTDGSGTAGRSRIAATGAYLAEFGIARGPLFGRFTDLAIYASVLEQDFELFVRLADELAEALARGGVKRVVGDAAEGFNVTHDVCRLLVNSAVEMAGGAGAIENYDFAVVGRPDECPETLRERAHWLRLDDESFGRKLGSARKYYPELVVEYRDAYEGLGEGPAQDFLKLGSAGARAGGSDAPGFDIFRVECLRPVGVVPDTGAADPRPFYELHGERQVAAGRFGRVIRRREHLLPLAEALARHAGAAH
ncbi:MAG: hypothetical protein LC800_06735 [Acidobacteria bacterium]|nr:hypothetical protein [Acidobacteriota bacterium]